MDGTTRALAQYGKIDLPSGGFKEKVHKSIVYLSTATFGGISLRDLGRISSLWLALLCLTIKALSFALILYSTVSTSMSKKFLSLSKSTTGATCKSISQPVVGTFEGDLLGFWKSSPNFGFNSSIYLLQFTGKGVTNEQYFTAMKRFTIQMAALGNLSSQSNARWAYMTWSSLNFVDPETGLHFFTNVDAGLVYNAPIQTAFMASAKGVCTGARRGPQISGYYDLGAKQTVLRFPITWNSTSETVTATVCPNHLSTQFINDNFAKFTSAQLKIQYIDFGFDVRMAALVVGLNAGVLTLESLIPESNPVTRKYSLIGYIDPFYSNPPQPYPIYCLDKSRTFEVYGVRLTPAQIKGPEICFIISSMKYSTQFMFYPASIQVKFQRAGDDSIEWRVRTAPEKDFRRMAQCLCPKDKEELFCQQTIILNAFFYSNRGYFNQTVLMAIRIQNDRLRNPSYSSSYYLSKAMLYAHTLSKSPWLAEIPLQSWTNKEGNFYDFSWARNKTYTRLLADEFAKICDSRCGMFFFETYSYADRTSMNTPMNKYGLALREISPDYDVTVAYRTIGLNLSIQMCVDTFSQPEAMAGLTITPPVNLEAPYYECTNTLLGAIIAGAGNAFATSTVITASIWTILGLCYLKLRKNRDGAVLLTEETKQRLNTAQAQMRSELIFEGFKQISGLLQPAFVAKLESARCIFYDQEPRDTLTPEESEGLIVCGKVISARLNRAESLDGLVNNEIPVQRRRITISMPSTESRKSFTGENALTRASSRLSSHPLGTVLQTLPPPTRASLSGGVRKSFAGIHQL